MVVGKLERSFLETLLGQTWPPFRSQLAKPVRVTTSVVCCDAPPNFNRLASRPGGGHDVPEREVLRPGAVAVSSSRAAASSARCCVCRTTLRVPTSNSTSGMYWRSSRGPSRQQRVDNLVFIYQDLTLPPDYELDYELGSPPGVMAEEVHLLWDLVAQRLFLASLHHSLAFNHQWQ